MFEFGNHILIDFEFASTFCPIDFGINLDTRALAVRLIKIDIFCKKTGYKIGEFDFTDNEATNYKTIYGLQYPEKTGTWTAGNYTKILFTLNKVPQGGVKVEIYHEVYKQILPTVLAISRINKGPEHSIVFNGGITYVECESSKSDEIPYYNILSASEENTTVSIIIINHNNIELMLVSLMSVLSAQIQVPYEIILVDNGSDYLLFNFLGQLEKLVRVVRLNEARSFGSANNIATEIARGDFILFLNNDAFLDTGDLEKLLAEFSDQSVGFVGPILRYPNGSLQDIGGYLSIEGRNSSPILNGCMWDYPYSSNPDYITAACLLLRRDDFLMIGGFNPDFHWAYWEDVDLCLRLRALGKNALLAKSCAITHIGSATSLQSNFDFIREKALIRNLFVFRSRWGRWLVTRDFIDGPRSNILDLLQINRQIDRFQEQKIHCIVPNYAFNRNPANTTMITHACTLSSSGPTMIVTETPYSILDIYNQAIEAGLDCKEMASIGFSSLENRDIDIVVFSCYTLPIVAPRFGRIRILHYISPPNIDEISIKNLQLGMEALLAFDAIITDSEFSRCRLLKLIKMVTSNHIDIDVIQPIVDIFPNDNYEKLRENIIVSVGPLRPGPAGGGHEAVIHAFKKLKIEKDYKNWQLVIIGYSTLDDDPYYIHRLQENARHLNIDILINPPRSILRKLFSKSKIYVSVRGLGIETSSDPWECAHSIAEIGIAISAGCVPVVFNLGAEAEFCEAEGIGVRFEDQIGLFSALKEANKIAGSYGLSKEKRRRMQKFSKTAHNSNWTSIISRIDTAAQRNKE